ncbi:bromodomain and WD repeat-containing 1, partial [Brachionus plicatilis]
TQASPSAARRSSRRARPDPQSTTGNLRFNLRSRHHAAEESNQGAGEHEHSSNGAYSWKDEAKKLLRHIFRHPDSGPFKQSVDTELYPDYGEVIKKPIDFTIIKNRLNYNMYNSDFYLFEKDCKLLFQNSKAYNTNKRSAIYSMTLRLESFCDEKLIEMRKRFEAAEQEKVRSNRSRTIVKL